MTDIEQIRRSLQMIASGTEDIEPPYRAMPPEYYRRIAADALPPLDRVAAAFADVEREALERAAKWHDNLAAQSRKEARQKDEEGWFQKGKDARENARWHEHFAFAIRALPPEQSGASSPINTTGATVIVHPGGVIHMGVDPAAPDPTKPESQAPMEAAPLPCPFCGDPAMIAEYGDGQHIVFCASCDCHPSPEETASDAIIAWNRRSGTADPTKALVTSHEDPKRALKALETLIDLAGKTYYLCDDSEDRDDEHVVPHESFADVCSALDTLDELPDDQPGYTMGPAAKASWSLRDVLAALRLAEDGG